MEITKITIEYCYEIIDHYIDNEIDIIKLFKYLLLDDKIIYKISIYIRDINISEEPILYIETQIFYEKLLHHETIEWYFHEDIEDDIMCYDIECKLDDYMNKAKESISIKDIIFESSGKEYICYSTMLLLKEYIEKQNICYINEYKKDFGDGDLFEMSRRPYQIYRYKNVFNFILQEENEYIFYICSSGYKRYHDDYSMLIKYKLNIKNLLLWEKKHLNKLFLTLNKNKLNKEYIDIKKYIQTIYLNKLNTYEKPNKLPHVIMNKIVDYII